MSEISKSIKMSSLSLTTEIEGGYAPPIRGARPRYKKANPDFFQKILKNKNEKFSRKKEGEL